MNGQRTAEIRPRTTHLSFLREAPQRYTQAFRQLSTLVVFKRVLERLMMYSA